MCYFPITIINPCKYVDVTRQDRFLLQVPCGWCAECQTNKSAEWSFRTYYEFLNTYEHDGFVYFDTLTYDDEHLPHMSEYHSELPNYPCFRSSDITKFFKRLRITLKRKFGIGNDAFSYFLCSEYGSLRYRPHYHLLLFFRKHFDPLKLSELVATTWNCGRTDGIPYKSSFYVLRHNVMKATRLGDTLACVKYVTKYVEKDCKLQSIIDKRIKHAEKVLARQGENLRHNSVQFKKMMTKLASEVNQFHVQSLHFGELALRDIDIDSLVVDGLLTMPSHQVVSRVALPYYYSRKLFYDRYQLFGNYGWKLNEVGKDYKAKRLPYQLKQLQDRFRALCQLGNYDYDIVTLADYVLTKRGRFRANLPESTIDERLQSITHYVYSNQSDKENIGCGVSIDFLGNSKLGYAPFNSDIIKFKDFIAKYVYLDYNLEAQLTSLYELMRRINNDGQNYYSRMQELKALFKQFES